MSDTMGKSWININANLPNHPVNVIKEDPTDENILYLGTDNALYISFNKGEEWQLFSNGIPKVAVHDLVIQEQAKDLLVGTHGRSIYKANIASLQQFNAVKNKSIAIFEIPSIKFSSRWGSAWSQWSEPIIPKISIPFYVANNATLRLIISTENDTELNQFEIQAEKGFNYFDYDLSVSNKKGIVALVKKDPNFKKAKNETYYLPKGTYKIIIGEATSIFEIK
jgi:hypothetical protein